MYFLCVCVDLEQKNYDRLADGDMRVVCSDRTMEVQLPALLGKYARPTVRPTDQRIEGS